MGYGGRGGRLWQEGAGSPKCPAPSAPI